MKHCTKIALLILSVLIAGCAGTFAPPDREEAPAKEKPRPQKTPEYDPLGLKEDLIVMPSSGKNYKVNDSRLTPATGQMSDSTVLDETEAISGSGTTYRIQLFTSKEYGLALKEMNVATEVFDRKVRLDYEVPYYKVRVGDFATQSDAEAYMPAAQEAGYKSAWVVKAYQDIKTLEDIYEEESIPIIDSLKVYDHNSEAVHDSLNNQGN